jgi:hypothetical protein
MNRPYWTIFRHQEVNRYLISLREAGEEIRAAVRSLENGIPADAWKKGENPETWEWIEARHYITFVILDDEKRWLGVTAVEPITVN